MTKFAKVVVAGGRTFNDYKNLVRNLDIILSRIENVEIVSGCAKGADRLGERYARERGLALKQFPADWDKHGKSAGFRRNEAMAKYGTHVIVFWDTKSKGTKHMIDIAKKRNLPLRIVTY